MSEVETILDQIHERHRPQELKDVVGHQEVKSYYFKCLDDRTKLTHHSLVGPPGIGKTTLVLAFAWAYYRGNQDLLDQYFHEYNASDQRGIDFIRTEIRDKTRYPPMGEYKYIIYLGEADGLTNDAMQTLRRIIENGNAIFILDLNKLAKMLDAILSRCPPLFMSRLSKEESFPILSSIYRFETDGDELTQELFDMVYYRCRGDLRMGIALMLMLDKNIKTPMMFIEELVPILAKKEYGKVDQLTEEYNKTHSPLSFSQAFAEFVAKHPGINSGRKMQLAVLLGELERDIKIGCDPKITLMNFNSKVMMSG